VLDSLKTKGIAIRVASPKLVMEEAPESYKDVTQARTDMRRGGCGCAVHQNRLRLAIDHRVNPRLGGRHLSRSGHFKEDGQATANCGHQRMMSALDGQAIQPAFGQTTEIAIKTAAAFQCCLLCSAALLGTQPPEIHLTHFTRAALLRASSPTYDAPGLHG
jgi:hypothetical protein